MIITFIILTLIYLFTIWFGNFLIDTLFNLLDSLGSRFMKNVPIKFVVNLSMVFHFILGFFLRLYLLTRLCKYYLDKKDDLTIFILVIIYLGFSLMKTVYNQPIKENRFSDEFFLEESRNYISKTINSVGVILSLCLFLLYYFNHSILKSISVVF